MTLTLQCRRVLFRALTVHPLVWGIAGFIVAYVTFLIIGGGGEQTSGSCVLCWFDTADNPVIPAATAGPPSALGGKIIKDAIEHGTGLPIFGLKDMIDIARQPTDEKQAEKGLDVLWNMLMIDDAPPDSPGGELKAAGKAFLDFGPGIGPDPVDPD